MSFLNLSGIEAGYGKATILNGLEITLERGEIGVIVGPNGAGKSTALKAIFGLINISAGRVTLEGRDITNQATESLGHLGMSFVPQEANVFKTLTVHENFEIGAFIRRDNFSGLLDRVYDIFPPLKAKRTQLAGELSGGQRQMVAVGRALMIDPKLILLDEPTAGLSPLFMAEIFERILAVNAAGVTVAMVEQNARQALSIAHRGFVLSGGRNRFTDTGAALLANPEVARSFLGG